MQQYIFSPYFRVYLIKKGSFRLKIKLFYVKFLLLNHLKCKMIQKKQPLSPLERLFFL